MFPMIDTRHPLNTFFEDFNHFWPTTSEKSHFSDYSLKRHNQEGVWYVELPVPGMNEKHVQVEIDQVKRQLKITAKKEEETSEEKDSFTWKKKAKMDRIFCFDLAEDLDINAITAHCENGLLTVKIKEVKQELENQGTKQVEVLGPKA